MLAKALLETISAKLKRELEWVEDVEASELIGLRYEPPTPHYRTATGDPEGELVGGGTEHLYWRVVPADSQPDW